MIRFENIKVLHDCYIDSNHHYHFTVTWRRGRDDYQPGSGFDHMSHPPAYLVDETNRQIVAMLKAGEFRFYEKDQNGDKRYTELRYRSSEYEAHMIDHLYDPISHVGSLPLDLRLLYALLGTPDYALFRTREEHRKSWDVSLLCWDDNDKNWYVRLSISSPKFDKLQPFLKCVKTGTNSFSAEFGRWIAANAPESHRAYEGMKE